MAEIRRAVVTHAPIDVCSHAALVRDPSAGAVASFEGVVRDHDHGRRVESLSYESHPDAAGALRAVLDAAAGGAGIVALAASHRVGELAIGDVALVVAVAAHHRGEAFATCHRVVDEIKARVPIWKRQVFTDGAVEWVHCT